MGEGGEEDEKRKREDLQLLWQLDPWMNVGNPCGGDAICSLRLEEEVRLKSPSKNPKTNIRCSSKAKPLGGSVAK